EPFSVSAFRSASSASAKFSVIVPFTLLNDAPSGKYARPIVTSTDPLTVDATAVPVVVILIDPLTVVRSASLCSDSARISPFTGVPVKLTPAGIRTSKCTCVSLFCVFMCPSSPGAHTFGSLPGTLGYTAQIVMPLEPGTTSIRTSAGLLRRAVLVATTSTSPDEEDEALIAPLMFLISIV